MTSEFDEIYSRFYLRVKDYETSGLEEKLVKQIKIEKNDICEINKYLSYIHKNIQLLNLIKKFGFKKNNMLRLEEEKLRQINECLELGNINLLNSK